MMGVYIKGMEMPTSCARCPMLEGDRLDGLCHAASRWLDDDEFWTWYAYPEGDIDDSKPCNCPLVPVPKHGRLIDADALRQSIKESIDECNKWADEVDGGEMYARVSQSLGTFVECSLRVKAAPTIIPAEEGE